MQKTTQAKKAGLPVRTRPEPRDFFRQIAQASCQTRQQKDWNYILDFPKGQNAQYNSYKEYFIVSEEQRTHKDMLKMRYDGSRLEEQMKGILTKRTRPATKLDRNGASHPKKKRVVRNGRPTTELVLSASLEGNDDVFPDILQLYVRPGSVVADITYGKGVFWRNVPTGTYKLRASDIQDGVDCRKLPYRDGELDCVVFDPPYMHTPGGTAHTNSHAPFETHYRNNGSGNQTASKYHEAVLDLYREGGREAYRTLKGRGIFIVKCQDEVCANRQRFTHVEIMDMYKEAGFIAEDLFVIVRSNRPGVSRMVRQVHARKNHSYFLVFWKQNGGNDRWEPPK